MQSNIYFPKTQNLTHLRTNGFSRTIGIAYIGNNFFDEIVADDALLADYWLKRFDDLAGFQDYLSAASISDIPYVLLVEAHNESRVFQEVMAIREKAITSGIIIILLTSINKTELQQKALEAKANDIYFRPFNSYLIFERINFLIKFKLLRPNEDQDKFSTQILEYKIPLVKRLFDIVVSSLALVLLLPFFILVAIIIKLESKGPVIYKSKRAGTGYKIFDFYKFRSMVNDADKKLEKLSKTSNQYANSETPAAFVKIQNDPRITRFGNFLRKTSIDELPQFFNVLKGDMSIVGNRPLPLYEAELLTSDQFAMRFLGPAGITGLWQITKRGLANMSDEERKELDNTYAKNSSFLMDCKIMLKTIPAMLQKEKV
ncbi:MAG: sugar transferase [Niabella sp.]